MRLTRPPNAVTLQAVVILLGPSFPGLTPGALVDAIRRYGPTPAPPAPDRLLSILEVSAPLGVSRRTAFSMIRRGQVAPVRLGRRTVRVSERALSVLIAGPSNTGKTP